MRTGVSDFGLELAPAPIGPRGRLFLKTTADRETVAEWVLEDSHSIGAQAPHHGGV
jgi:hypothetical protein